MSIPRPNYTQTPNAIYDLMPQMKEAELRITLAIIRETFGWHRETAKLSISKLQKLTGLSRQGVINGTEAGIERGTIIREKEGDGYLYSLHVNEVDTDSQLVNVVDYPSQRSRLPLVNVVDQQNAIFPEVETAPKESIKETTIKKERSISCAATQTPASSPSKKKEKEKKPEHPNTKAIFDAYCAVVSEAEPGCKILYPATRIVAQELAAAGWEPEQVTKAFWLMKKDAFWKAKHLTLMSVQKQIAALLKGKSNASDSEFKDPSIYGGEIQFTTEIDLDTLSFNF